MSQVELGDRVKDKISGLKGIAIGVTNWLYGCRRITVQPEVATDGKPAEAFAADEPQLEIVKEGIIKPAHPVVSAQDQKAPPRRHGPRKDPSRF